MRYIDTHAHVFSHQAPFAKDVRYTPDHTVTAEDYIRELDRYGFTHGVLIQPSFYGEDNSYMLGAIAKFPERLKGVAVVSERMSLDAMQKLKDQGIVGVRLNLFGKPCPDLTETVWQQFLARVTEMGWQLELHAPPKYLVQLLPPLAAYALDVVIDHFGRFDPKTGVASADYQAFLDMLNPKQHWVKVSGFYRLGKDNGVQNAKDALALLLARDMQERLIWGSDWPHTQHDEMSFDISLTTFKAIVDDDNLVKKILIDNNAKLFNVAQPVA